METIRTRITAAVLFDIECDDEITRYVCLTTGTQANIIESETSVGVCLPFVEIDISTSTLSNFVMTPAPRWRMSTGCGCERGNEEQ